LGNKMRIMRPSTWAWASCSLTIAIILNTIAATNVSVSAEEKKLSEGHVPTPEKPGWQLTFHDEFNPHKLDEKKWFDRYRAGRIRYYKKKGIPKKKKKAPRAHYVIEDGILHLRIDESLPARLNKHASTVTSIQTSEIAERPDGKGHQANSRFVQKYGWFEIRCRMPAGSGLHSAFWLLHADPHDQEYTLDGKRRKIGDGVVEIDIFEQLGRETVKNKIRFNIHFTKSGHKNHHLDFDPSKEFHVYALEWKEGELIWHIDGKKVWTYKGETPKKEMYVLVGLYQGAGWTGEVDKKMRYPRDFEVDYVRVYARQNRKSTSSTTGEQGAESDAVNRAP
jgi:beta-glucanase (GH16 family)